MSLFVPGLGQMAGGDVPRGVALLALTVAAFALTRQDARLLPFLACLWLYQLLDARRREVSPEELSVSRKLGQRWAPRLIALGLLFLFLTVVVQRFSRAPLLVPVLLIAAGIRLLYTYFRGAEERE